MLCCESCGPACIPPPTKKALCCARFRFASDGVLSLPGFMIRCLMRCLADWMACILRPAASDPPPTPPQRPRCGRAAALPGAAALCVPHQERPRVLPAGGWGHAAAAREPAGLPATHLPAHPPAGCLPAAAPTSAISARHFGRRPGCSLCSPFYEKQLSLFSQKNVFFKKKQLAPFPRCLHARVTPTVCPRWVATRPPLSCRK